MFNFFSELQVVRDPLMDRDRMEEVTNVFKSRPELSSCNGAPKDNVDPFFIIIKKPTRSDIVSFENQKNKTQNKNSSLKFAS